MKISLITVCYNSEKTIEDTLNSVLNQTYKNYEYVIVDGKSSDNTLEIIRKYEPKFEGKIKIISEKDKGLYDAMNKGIDLSTGDIIGILNSDDILSHENVFEHINNAFENNNIDGVYANLVFLDEKLNKKTRIFKAGKVKKILGWHPPHPTLYIKKGLYKKVGYYNLNYKIAADYDFMLRMLKTNPKLYYLKEYTVKMRSGGVSTDGLKGYKKSLKESTKVLKNNKIKLPYFSNLLRILKTFNQSLLAKLYK